MKFQRVCIFGAGAIGGWLGVKLARAGCEVSVVARGDTLRSLEQHGLRLQEADEITAVPVVASAEPAALGPQDLVVIAVKAPALPQVAKSIGPLIGPDTVVLTAMNGVPWWFLQGLGGRFGGRQLESVDPGGALARAIAVEHIIGCVVHASCSLNEPGFVKHHFSDKLIVGEPSGENTPRVREIVSLFGRAGLETVLTDRIQGAVWYKLWGNLTANPISTLTGATTDLMLDDELVRTFMCRVMLEAKEIGARIGVPIAQEPEDRQKVTRKLGAIRTSMLQDAEAGRPVELDAVVTVVKELGELAGVPTPFIDALLGLARLHCRVRGLY